MALNLSLSTQISSRRGIWGKSPSTASVLGRGRKTQHPGLHRCQGQRLLSLLAKVRSVEWTQNGDKGKIGVVGGKTRGVAYLSGPAGTSRNPRNRWEASPSTGWVHTAEGRDATEEQGHFRGGVGCMLNRDLRERKSSKYTQYVNILCKYVLEELSEISCHFPLWRASDPRWLCCPRPVSGHL